MSVAGTEDVWFVNFYSPQCSHCHHLAPTVSTRLTFNPLSDDKVLDWSKFKQICRRNFKV